MPTIDDLDKQKTKENIAIIREIETNVQYQQYQRMGSSNTIERQNPMLKEHKGPNPSRTCEYIVNQQI